MKKIVIFGLVSGLMLALWGCTTAPRRDKDLNQPAMLEPKVIVKFSDIPVPANFKLLPLDSYSFESSGIRVALLQYVGKAPAEQVITFYKEQMPMYNWNLLNIVEFGERMLTFDRDTEICVVRLVPRGNNILTIITLGPKSRPNQKPVK